MSERAKKLRAYMGFCRIAGSEEGAVLIFAHTAAEAKRIAFPTMRSLFDCEWTCAAINRLREDCDHMRRKDGPHVIDNPPSCAHCEQWHSEPLDADGLCEGCAEEATETAV